MRFLLSPQAAMAMDNLWDYYFEQGGTNLADRILADIHDAINRLVEAPGLGHSRPDLTSKPLKFYRVHRLFLVYDPTSSPLYVARIYHSAQDVENRLKIESD